MSEKIHDIVKSLLDGMHSISHTETIVGEPMQLGDATIVPVHRLRVGFLVGAGAAGAHAERGEGKTGSRALGGGAQVDPVAVIAVGADGRPRLLAVDGEAEGTWQRLLRDAPEVVSRLVQKAAARIEGAVSRPPVAQGGTAAPDAIAAPAGASAPALPAEKPGET